MESRRFALCVPAVALGAAVLGCQPSPNVQTGDMTGGLTLLVEKAIQAEQPKSSTPKAGVSRDGKRAAKASPAQATDARTADQHAQLPWSIGHHIVF